MAQKQRARHLHGDEVVRHDHGELVEEHPVRILHLRSQLFGESVPGCFNGTTPRLVCQSQLDGICMFDHSKV